MPEGSTQPPTGAAFTGLRGSTRPNAGASHVGDLKKKYDDLAKQTSEAATSGAEPREVERLKAEKLKAFAAYKQAEDAETHAKRDAGKGASRNEGIDPGSPIVAR